MGNGAVLSASVLAPILDSTEVPGRGFAAVLPAQESGGAAGHVGHVGAPPAFPLPPFISPSGSNGLAIPWFQNQEAARMPEYDSWNLSIQRQLWGSAVLDLAYNGQVGTHLQSALLNINQVRPSYLQTLGPAVLNSNINSALAQASGIAKPYPTFNGSVAQALRPYPQFSGIDKWSGAGDHSGHSSYHAGIIKLEKRYSSGLTFQTSYVFSKLFTDSDTYWVTDNPRAADQYNRRLEKSIVLVSTSPLTAWAAGCCFGSTAPALRPRPSAPRTCLPRPRTPRTVHPDSTPETWSHGRWSSAF
jgi:hypothetical protein